MHRQLLPAVAGVMLAAAAATIAGFDADGHPGAPSPQSPQSPRARGLKVTYEPLDASQRAKEGVHSYRARLLSLAVERGETPTPMLSPGLFRATLRGTLTLPVRDRYRFQIVGKGTVRLTVGGQTVLSGTLRPARALETAQAIRLDKGDNAVVCEFESTAMGEAQLRVLWAGPDFGWEPIPPELWQWDADDPEIAAGERMRAGHQAFVAGRCVRCHLPDRPAGESAFGELDDTGPDLRAIGARVHSGFLVEWLTDPRQVRSDASMPRFRFETQQEVLDVAAWLATLGQPLPDPQFTAEQIERGSERFHELGCVACHVAPGIPDDPASPPGRLSLGFVPRKWRAAALVLYLQDPARDHPSVRMPDYRLDADDARVLAAYLLRDAGVPAPALPGNAESGRRLAQRHGCDRCHELQLPQSGLRFRDLVGLHPAHGCLDNGARSPDYAFDEATRAALRAFLPRALEATRRRAPLDFTARWVAALRCTSCHGLDGEASIWAGVVAAASEREPVPPEQDPVAQGVPALTWVGAKLQPEWMDRFLTGREVSPRPWLHARMPVFRGRGAVLARGLAQEHGYPPQDELEKGPDAQLAQHGARLVRMGEGFGCVQCHALGDQPPVQVFERQGINFRIAASRLRQEYYLRWLLDPLRIDPDSRMPKYADGKGRTAFTEVLGGDARQQFEAIWHYFRTLK